MRADVHGGSRKYVLLTKGVGLQDAVKGERIRKLIRGNTISEEIYQINCKFDGDMPIEKAPETKEAPKTKAPETKEAPKTKAPETKSDSTPKDKKPKKKE